MTELKKIESLLYKILPHKRSLLGFENLKTLEEIKKIIPIKIKSFKSGFRAYDWKVPLGWNCNSATIMNENNEIIIDYKKNPFHVAAYSKKIKLQTEWKNIKNKIFFNKELSSSIPYRTFYYKRDWGFCVTKKQFQILSNQKGKLKISINSKFTKDKMYYGELIIKGTSKKEILITTYICHPHMINDNISGVIVSTFLAKKIKQKKRRFTYRILFVSETIGSISYIKKNLKQLKKTYMGLVITTCGGPGNFSYKKSINKDHTINLLIESYFREKKINFKKYDFESMGSDERQYSSYPLRINMASIFKDKYYEYKEYHTSNDNLIFTKPENILKGLKIYEGLVEYFDKIKIYKKKQPYCETMLSKYKLHNDVGGEYKKNLKSKFNLEKLLKVLFYIDGNSSTAYISNKTNLNIKIVENICSFFKKKKIIRNILQ